MYLNQKRFYKCITEPDDPDNGWKKTGKCDEFFFFVVVDGNDFLIPSVDFLRPSQEIMAAAADERKKAFLSLFREIMTMALL